MTTRTTINTVTFKRPFVLGNFNEIQPAGAYRVETDEELMEGISFPVYRRTLTMIHLHASPRDPGRTQMLDINPNDLDAALKRDRVSTELPADPEIDVLPEVRDCRSGRMPDAQAPARLEPDLDEMMADPIVRLVMRSDGLSQDAAWDAIKTARAHMAAGLGADKQLSGPEIHQAETDRQAMERSEDKGMMVHLG